MKTEDKKVLREAVLDSMVNGYESFTCVVEQVSQWKWLKVTASRQEIAEALESAIREGFAQAYLLSPQPPHATQVDFSYEFLNDHWSYVTPKGKQFVNELEGRINE